MSSSTSVAKPTILYVADPRADVVLRSSDGIDFFVRRVSLEANSEVFDDMFASSSGEVGDKDQETEHPIIKLDEKGEDLDVFIRCVVRGQLKPVVSKMSAERAFSYLRVCDKYGVEGGTEEVVARLKILAASNPIEVLGPALMLQHLQLVRAALSKFGKDYSWRTERISNMVIPHPRGIPCRLSDVPSHFFEGLSMSTILRLVSMEEEVLLGAISWERSSSYFTFE